MTHREGNVGRYLRGALLRTPPVAMLGWAFVEGVVTSPVLAAASVLVVVCVSLAVIPPGRWRWRPLALARFVPFFIRESLHGGVDVAARALHPRLPVHPGAIDYALRLPPGSARVFFVTVLSLFPGTLSTRVDGDEMRNHLLDREVPVTERIEALERRVAELFAVSV